ncbi:MAG: hypothetical protein ACOH12_00495 [Parvibaculaceae bacterium]
MTPAQLRSYFDLQLRFAAVMAEAEDVSLATSVTHNTNIHRRFGLGTFRAEAVDPHWLACCAEIERAPSHAACLDVVCNFFARAPIERLPNDQLKFGCFSLETQAQSGAVKLHFGNRLDNPEGQGPLHASRRGERMEELRALFAHVKRHIEGAQIVRGGSWLYHIEAYRRLFPPSFAASRREAIGNRNFAGTSSWGQFLDHRGDLKAEPVAKFLENLDVLDPEHPARAFPMPALNTQASVGDFFAFYDV